MFSRSCEMGWTFLACVTDANVKFVLKLIFTQDFELILKVELSFLAIILMKIGLIRLKNLIRNKKYIQKILLLKQNYHWTIFQTKICFDNFFLDELDRLLLLLWSLEKVFMNTSNFFYYKMYIRINCMQPLKHMCSTYINHMES